VSMLIMLLLLVFDVLHGVPQMSDN